MVFYLSDFHSILAKHEAKQEHLLDWTSDLHTIAQFHQNEEPSADIMQFQEHITKKFFEVGYNHKKIEKRRVHIDDFLQQELEDMPVYQPKLFLLGMGLKEKMQFFDTSVSSIFEEFYPSDVQPPDHMIHVTCTGYTSPSGAQKLVSKRRWHEQVGITHAYHMGCYGALSALRISQGQLHLANEHCDIIHTEICSLHMNPLKHSTDQLVVQSLFADGFIKYRVQSKKPKRSCFSILAIQEEVIPDTLDEMFWQAQDGAFGFTLTKQVPVHIANTVKEFVDKMVKKANLKMSDIKDAIFAVHPGGPKIIAQVAKMLEISPKQIEHSEAILKNYGNMSSATLPHIWQMVLNDPAVKPKTAVVSLAFGPGLTVFGAIFIKEA